MLLNEGAIGLQRFSQAPMEHFRQLRTDFVFLRFARMRPVELKDFGNVPVEMIPIMAVWEKTSAGIVYGLDRSQAKASPARRLKGLNRHFLVCSFTPSVTKA
jgi:hypothetical protein